MARIKTSADGSVLSGTNRADVLIVDGADNVTVAGRRGNDTYRLYDAHDTRIIEDAGGGVDTVVYYGGFGFDGFTLPDEVENLLFRGNGGDYGYGNALDNTLDASRSTAPTDLFGLDGDDTLIGSKQDDTLHGGDGNDRLSGGRGDDGLYGGDGNDTLDGGYGDDFLHGDYGNDRLDGGDQVEFAIAYGDSQYGYGGSDVLYGGAGDDVLLGGNDTIFSDSSSSYGYGAVMYAGDDVLYGGHGNDTLIGGNNRLEITGGAQAYVLFGGSDMFSGGDGNDILNGGTRILSGGDLPLFGAFADGNYGGREHLLTGRDILYGGDDNDRIRVGNRTADGNGGDDAIYGSADRAFGGNGNDNIQGGNVTLRGGSGDDVVYGAPNWTWFSGDAGNDVITGGTLNLLGGSGNDLLATERIYLYGDGRTYLGDEQYAGNDRITGRTIRMDGGNGDDVFYGPYQYFLGGGGDDLILGRNTTILGGDGDDRVYLGRTGAKKLGGEGHAFQVMYGGYGNDTLTAGQLIINLGAGENTIYGDARDSAVYAYGGGYVKLHGGYGNDTLRGNNGDDLLFGEDGRDLLFGNNGNDRLFGGHGNDVLNGGRGDDVFRGGYGSDTDEDNDRLLGGAGDDSFYVSSYGGNDVIVAGPGDDTVFVFDMDFNAGAGLENVVDNGGGSFTFTGNGLDNYLYGGGGDDTLIGQGGDDLLRGGAGRDRLEGGTGDDNYITGENGDAGDVVVELPGQGTDSVFVNLYGEGVVPDNVENLTLSQFAGATTIIGNALNNELVANDSDNVVYGGAGNDLLVTGGGADVLFGGRGNDVFVVDDANDLVFELNGQGTDTVRSNDSFTLGSNVENLAITANFDTEATGNALNNRIEGGNGDDLIDGQGGNDTLLGGRGSDTYLLDSLGDTVVEAANGGDDDTIDVNTTALAGTFALAAHVEHGILRGTGNLNLTGTNSDNSLTGNNADNTLNGRNGDDRLYGGGGDDTLLGGGGDDVLHGGRGNDFMRGNPGDDIFFVDRGDGAGGAIGGANEDRVIEAAGQGTDTVVSSVYTYTLDNNVENLNLAVGTGARKGFGNNLANTMIGNELNNTLAGGGGNDTLYGGLGRDTLAGDAGNDILDGGPGDDTMSGGAGNDTFMRHDLGDAIVEGPNGGTDLERRFDINDGHTALAANVENLTLYGDAFIAYGNALDNVITGRTHDFNFLYGDGGNDRLIGSDYGNNLFGGENNDTLIGGDAGDSLNGGDGNDVLDGGDGADSLYGGAGNDRMSGGFGDDNYQVDSAGDVVIEGTRGGHDTVIVRSLNSLSVTLANNVENLRVSFDDPFEDIGHTLTGNDLDNNITGSYGSDVLNGGGGDDVILGAFLFGPELDAADIIDGGSGDDKLYGFGGDDIILGGSGNDVIDGGSGNDAMTGGAGDDTFLVDSGDGAFGGQAAFEDRVFEAAGGGNDTVVVSRGLALPDYMLPDQVENLWVQSNTNALFGVGNASANTFTVDQLVDGDVFEGLAGDDTLSATLQAGTGGTAILSTMETVDLSLEFGGGEAWNILAGPGSVLTNVNISGNLGAGALLQLNDIAAANSITLHNLFAGDPTELLELRLADSFGFGDMLNIALHDTLDVAIGSTGVETLSFHVQGASNHVDVRNVLGDLSYDFTGTSAALTVTGLQIADQLQLRSLAANSVELPLQDASGASDFLRIDVDDVVIGTPTSGGLYVDGGGAPASLETLFLDTRGDPGFDHGGSFLNLAPMDPNGGTFIELTGLQDLTLANLQGGIDAHLFSGDLTVLSSGGAGIYFEAGTGNDHVMGGSGADLFVFGENLDDLDYVHGGPGGGDQVTASLAGGTHTLQLFDIDFVNLTLLGAGDTFTFDLGESTNFSGNSMNFTLLGDSTADVTFQNPVADGNDWDDYRVDASGLTTGTLTARLMSVSPASGFDFLIGGGGADYLSAGGGSNTLTGNGNADTFAFENFDLGGANFTTVTDFSGFAGEGDMLALSLSIFGEIGTVGNFSAAAFRSGASLTDAQDVDDRVIYDTLTGTLYYDGDGLGGDTGVEFATLAGMPGLSAADFDVIT